MIIGDETMSIISASDKKQYENDGYLVLRGIYSRESMNELKNQIWQIWIDKVRKSEINDQKGNPLESLFCPLQETHRTYHSIWQFLLDSRSFEIAQNVLNEKALAVGTTCFFKPPGSKALPLHQDNNDIGPHGGAACGVWTSIDYAGPRYGGLCIVPGSHKLGYHRADHSDGILNHLLSHPPDASNLPFGYQIMRLETFPGDVVIFDGNLIHGSLSNITDYEFRYSIAMHFVPETIEKVFANFNYLVNRNGEVVSKPLNKRFSMMRMDY
jgi:ectoine hydroxylase-related dioxygenase (phytanoyl-CoA dioxygenase family)